MTAHIAGQLLQSGAITGNTTLRYELHDNGDGLPPTLTVTQRPMSPLPPPVPNTVSSGGHNVGGDGGGHGEDRDEKDDDNEQDSAGSDDDEETEGESKRDQGSENNDDSNDQDDDSGNVQGNQNSSDDGDGNSDDEDDEDDKEQVNSGEGGSSEDDSDEDNDDDDEDYQEPKKAKARKKIASSSEDEDEDEDEEDEQDNQNDNSKKPRLKFSVPRKDPPDTKQSNQTVPQSAKRKKGTVVGPEKEPRNKELPIRPLDNHLLDVLSNTPHNGFRTHRQKMWVVIQARKKRDPNFRWPNPENSTEEEEKRIEAELEAEVAGLQRRIDDKVEKLIQKHFKGMMKGRSQTLKDTQETRDVQSKAMQQAFKELEVTEADKKEIQEWKDDMSEEDLEAWEKLERDAEEVAYIKYRPSYTDEEGRTFYASFDTRTSEGGKVTSWNDPFWVGSWLSVIFYRLCIHMKNSLLHVPAGDVCLDVAPVEFMRPISTKHLRR